MPRPLHLHPDRLFPAEPGHAAIARALYASVRDLPIVSPHGHTDPALVRDRRAVDRTRPSCCSRPTIISYRMLYSQGVPLEELGVADARRARRPPIRARPGGCSPRTTTCSAARRRGCGSTMSSPRCSASTSRSMRRRADLYFDRIDEALATPAFRPRALFERFNIEVLATTEGAASTISTHHARDPRSGLEGAGRHHLPARRRWSIPSIEDFAAALDAVRRADRRGRRELGRLSRRAPQAPRRLQRSRRDLDRSRPSDRAHRRPRARRRPRRCSRRIVARQCDRRTTPSCSAPRC